MSESGLHHPDHSQQKADLWHTATLADMRIDEYRRHGPAALAHGLQTDDTLEALLRQLTAARDFNLFGDANASNSMLGIRASGDTVTPQWLQDESRAYSTALHRQSLRARDTKATGGDAAAAAGEKDKGDGRGKGKGK